jgi:hypothetical protein
MNQRWHFLLLRMRKALDCLIMSLSVALLAFALCETLLGQSAAGRTAAVGEASPPVRAGKHTANKPLACNATPDACSVLPACDSEGERSGGRAACADPLAFRANLALSEALDDTAPGKEGGGHAPAIPGQEDPPETDTLPKTDRSQADNEKNPYRCNAFPERPANNSPQNELCAYLSSAIRNSDTCLNSLWDRDAQRSGKRARGMRRLHTRLRNLKTEHALQCGTTRKIIGFRHIPKSDFLILQQTGRAEERDWDDF